MKVKWVRKSASKELTFHNFDKCLLDITNKPVTKEQITIKSYNYRFYTVTSNKIAISNPNENDKKNSKWLQDNNIYLRV